MTGLSKQKITAADAAALAVSIIRATSGDVTGLAAQIPKWIMPIVSFAGCFLIIIAIIISSPLIILGGVLFPGSDTAMGAFYAEQAAGAEAFIAAFEAKERTRAQNSGLESMQTYLLGQYDVWDTQSDIDVKLNKEELLILYSVMYDDYSGSPADYGRLDSLTDVIVNRTENISSSRFPVDIPGMNTSGLYATNYLFTYSARLKTFPQIIETLDLSDEQKARAMVMYRYLYNQDQGGVYGNDINGVDLGDIVYSDGLVDVVYFSQRDSRWFDTSYGQTGTIGRSGCGPTALAIAISSLGGSAVFPTEVADWAAGNGYYVEGGGSLHALIPNGAGNWNVPAIGAGYDWQAVVDALSDGKLVIAIMGSGHFTSNGHYIVLRGLTDDGKIMVADPASVKRSEELWDAEIIVNEARKDAAAGGAFWILG